MVTRIERPVANTSSSHVFSLSLFSSLLLLLLSQEKPPRRLRARWFGLRRARVRFLRRLCDFGTEVRSWRIIRSSSSLRQPRNDACFKFVVKWKWSNWCTKPLLCHLVCFSLKADVHTGKPAYQNYDNKSDLILDKSAPTQPSYSWLNDHVYIPLVTYLVLLCHWFVIINWPTSVSSRTNLCSKVSKVRRLAVTLCWWWLFSIRWLIN